jgi:hypothetical protein
VKVIRGDELITFYIELPVNELTGFKKYELLNVILFSHDNWLSKARSVPGQIKPVHQYGSVRFAGFYTDRKRYLALGIGYLVMLLNNTCSASTGLFCGVGC